MAKATITTKLATITLDVEPHADFFSCILPALFESLPVFLSSFMTCISGGGSTTDYQPGSRHRCAD